MTEFPLKFTAVILGKETTVINTSDNNTVKIL